MNHRQLFERLRDLSGAWSDERPWSRYELTDDAPKNRRRFLRILQLKRGPNTYMNGHLIVEYSPRRVGCSICGGLIQGNSEPRLTLRVPTGIHNPNAFWMAIAEVRFHIDCMQAFLLDSSIHDVNEEAIDRCDGCGRLTVNLPADGKRHCAECKPYLSKRAQTKVIRNLAELERTYGET